MHRTRLPNRLQGYNYSSNALYFVTSCVHDRVCCFGEIRDHQMFLNEYGQIADLQWQWLIRQYIYVVSHSFIVMPNHIHGVIEIDDGLVGTGRDLSNDEKDDRNVRTGRDLSNDGDRTVQTGRDLSVRPKIKSLSELMGAYKTTTSKQIHLLGLEDFKWQRSFHDHII